MDEQLSALSTDCGRWLARRGWHLVTAESCTGGWIAEVVTATAGSSIWFDCGFVTYSNESKQALLDVSAATLGEHGAVSEETVCEMVAGALARSRADVATAVSGIAGPGGASAGKPVGTVYIAWGKRGGTPCARRFQFDTAAAGNVRESVRRQTVIAALRGLMTMDQ